MILDLFKLEIRKHFPIFSVFILMEAVLSTLVLVDYNKYINIHLQLSAVAWIVLPIYIFIDLYNNFYIGKDVILHMIPMKTSTKLLVKSTIFSMGLMLMWATCLIFELFNSHGIYHTRILHSSSPTLGIVYFILARFIGCISGPIIIGVSIALSKLVKNKISSISIIAAVLLGITIGFYLIMKSNLAGQGKVFYSIGTTSQDAFKQSAGLVSLLVQSDKHLADISKSIYWNNLFYNFLVYVFGYVIISSIFNSKKYEVLGK
ncbi:hypothetical protein [Clostridium sp. JN-1]|uniref:hypothetical protein n=1 Tax=Clostridium sp. JN-1 TaxID=2483110 RepID=UPI000F0BBD97|nr:hypothetical protein [Clostridium sp. JN-1]